MHDLENVVTVGKWLHKVNNLKTETIDIDESVENIPH